VLIGEIQTWGFLVVQGFDERGGGIKGEVAKTYQLIFIFTRIVEGLERKEMRTNNMKTLFS
jgi:hypothetical protein